MQVKSIGIKKIIYVLFFAMSMFFWAGQVYAQCTPMDETGCPDPEGNGEICPDSLSPVFVGVTYTQEVTMLAPPEIDTLGFNLDLHHITLVDVAGLPEGIDWVTNAANDEFFPEIYYCILFSGTSNAEVGDYPLKVIVDIYAKILGEPVNILQLTDSTSLKMEVLDPNSIAEQPQAKLVSKVWPNPFYDQLSLEFGSGLNSAGTIQLYNLMGKMVYSQNINKISTNVSLYLEGINLPAGLYFLSVERGNKKYSQLVSKIN